MKVLIGTNSDVGTWFPEARPEFIELMAEGLNGKALLGVTSNQLSEFSSTAVFEMLVTSMSAVALVKDSSVCDVVQEGNTSIPLLVKKDVFEFYQKLRCSEPGDEKSEALFKRKFEKLSLVGKQIDFIDQHFWKNLSSPDKGAFFLLNKFLSESSIDIRIYSAMAYTAHDNRIAEENLRKLVEKYGRMGSVEVYLYKNRSGRPFLHDRISRISFEKGSIGFTVGHGSELFGKHKVPVGGVLTEVKVVFDAVTKSLREVDSEPTKISV